MGDNKKMIAISGATGFIGTSLTKYFNEKGYRITPLLREDFKLSNKQKLNEKINKSQIIINLAGVPINHRWTNKYKKEILSSRLNTTNAIVEAINQSNTKPEIFFSTSAIGIYPDNNCYDEYDEVRGKGFLADVCQQWEEAAQNVSGDVRLIITRLGVVFDKNYGSFPLMSKPAKYRVATTLGDGKQALSWIDLKDLERAYDFIINNNDISGIVNFTSPGRITNKKFTEEVADYYKSFVKIKIPEFAIKSILGEASSFIIGSLCVKPTKLLQHGFHFTSTSFQEFLK